MQNRKQAINYIKFREYEQFLFDIALITLCIVKEG